MNQGLLLLGIAAIANEVLLETVASGRIDPRVMLPVFALRDLALRQAMDELAGVGIRVVHG